MARSGFRDSHGRTIYFEDIEANINRAYRDDGSVKVVSEDLGFARRPTLDVGGISLIVHSAGVLIWLRDFVRGENQALPGVGNDGPALDVIRRLHSVESADESVACSVPAATPDCCR